MVHWHTVKRGQNYTGKQTEHKENRDKIEPICNMETCLFIWSVIRSSTAHNVISSKEQAEHFMVVIIMCRTTVND